MQDANKTAEPNVNTTTAPVSFVFKPFHMNVPLLCGWEKAIASGVSGVPRVPRNPGVSSCTAVGSVLSGQCDKPKQKAKMTGSGLSGQSDKIVIARCDAPDQKMTAAAPSCSAVGSGYLDEVTKPPRRKKRKVLHLTRQQLLSNPWFQSRKCFLRKVLCMLRISICLPRKLFLRKLLQLPTRSSNLPPTPSNNIS